MTSSRRRARSSTTPLSTASIPARIRSRSFVKSWVMSHHIKSAPGTFWPVESYEEMEIVGRNSAYAEFYKPGTGRVSAASLTNEELERRLKQLVASESEATGDVVEHVAEFERRRLFSPKSFPTMFEYCTKTLGYSGSAAYLRIYAGRLANQYPEI